VSAGDKGKDDLEDIDLSAEQSDKASSCSAEEVGLGLKGFGSVESPFIQVKK
jgi:hypothetical protein